MATTSIFRTLLITYLAVFIGQGVWRSTFYNLGIEQYGLSPVEIGWFFSVAAIPGVFTFALGLIARKMSLSLLAPVVILLFGCGLVFTGMAADKLALIAGVLMISVGAAWYLPLANSICLHENALGVINRRMGLLKSMGPLAGVVATMMVVSFGDEQGIRHLFIVVGVTVLLVGLITARQFKVHNYSFRYTATRLTWALWPIYLLNFIAGCRSAIFKAFIITQFVFLFKFSVGQMSIMLLTGSLLGIAGYRVLGLLADRYPPGKVLALLYLTVAILFAGFNWALQAGESAGTVAVVFFLFDSLLIGSAVITDSALKWVDSDAHTLGDLAFGASFFHLAGVLVPLIGGVLIGVTGNVSSILILGLFAAVLGAALSASTRLLRRCQVTL